MHESYHTHLWNFLVDFFNHLPVEPCMLQCVAVCCSVLQCVAVCCSVLQCVAVFCSVLKCVAVCFRVFRCVSVYCSVLQCVAVCCSVLQCVVVCCSVLQREFCDYFCQVPIEPLSLSLFISDTHTQMQ